VPQGTGVVAFLAAGRDHQRAETDHVGQAVPDRLRRPRAIEAAGQALGDAEAALDLAQRQHAAIAGQTPAVEASGQRLAANR